MSNKKKPAYHMMAVNGVLLCLIFYFTYKIFTIPNRIEQGIMDCENGLPPDCIIKQYDAQGTNVVKEYKAHKYYIGDHYVEFVDHNTCKEVILNGVYKIENIR